MFGLHSTGSASGPAMGGFAITPADSDLSARTRAVWVGTAGDLRVTFVNGDDVVIKGASGLLPIAVKRVWATGTTATNVMGMY